MIEHKLILQQKEKLHRDQQRVEADLIDVTKKREHLKTTLNAIDGALQTVDYFLKECIADDEVIASNQKQEPR
jgi:hypothetical protein